MPLEPKLCRCSNYSSRFQTTEMISRFSWIALVTLASTGCVTAAWYANTARERAAFDFNCPLENVSTRELGTFSEQGASGCGQRGTYVYTSHYGWVLTMKDGKPLNAVPPPPPSGAQ